MNNLSSDQLAAAEAVARKYLSRPGSDWCWESLIEDGIPVLGLKLDRVNELVYLSATALRSRFPKRSWKQATASDVVRLIIQQSEDMESGLSAFNLKSLQKRKERVVGELGPADAEFVDRLVAGLLVEPKPLHTLAERDGYGIYGMYRDPLNKFPSKIGETERPFSQRIPEHVSGGKAWWGSCEPCVTLLPATAFPELQDQSTRRGCESLLLRVFPGAVNG